LINCPSDAEIHERVMKVGPFVQTALCWSSDELQPFIDNRAFEIDGHVNDPSKLYGNLYQARHQFTTHVLKPES